MASVEKTETYDAPIESFYKVLTDYESYPEFMDGCDEVEIITNDDGNAEVRYSLNVIKKFEYTLEMTVNKPTLVEWSFVEGDIFKKNNGAWRLEDLGDGQTQVTYELDVDMKLMVPKMIANKLVKTNLPALMNSVYERAKSL